MLTMETLTQSKSTSKVALDEFLSALFPKEDEAIFIRTFQAKGAPEGFTYPNKWDSSRKDLLAEESGKQLTELNKKNGIYFIVNSGGHKDKDITRFNAFFVERDSGSLQEQHAKLDEAPIKTSARVETLNSVHAYYLIEGDCTEADWREIQSRLIAYFDADPQNKNPSRCMRLPGWQHVTYIGTDDLSYKTVEVVQFDPSRRYSVSDMLSAFPVRKKGEEKTAKGSMKLKAVTSNSEFATHEERHSELVRRIITHPTATRNDRGNYDCRGICHNGAGNTAILYAPQTEAVHCNKGCSYFDILRVFDLPNCHLPSSKSSESQAKAGDDDERKPTAFPALNRTKALYGLAGDIVRAIEPHSEADPTALLVQLIVAFGNVAKRTAYFVAEADRHHMNLFTVIVGDSSRGRKGSSLGYIRSLMEEADENWAGVISGGLTSGEGLVHHVRDEDGGFMPGAIRQGKRALVVESEFASVLKAQSRQGSTLSTIIRQAWDTGNLSVMRRDSPDKATNAHISIIGHITGDELRQCLNGTDTVNGYANRFLWVVSRRSKKLPEGGYFNLADHAPLIARLKKAIEFAGTVGEMKRDEEARELWREIYGHIDDELPSGRLEAILSRAEAQIMRLACVYALLDCSNIVRRVHLEAAKAVWDYSVASTRYVFGSYVLGKKAQKFLDLLHEAGTAGLNKTDLFRKNGGRSDGLNEALAELEQTGYAFSVRIPTDGRDEERWFAARGNVPQSNEFDESDEERFKTATSDSSNSSNPQDSNFELVSQKAPSKASELSVGGGRVENLFDLEENN